MRKDELRTRLLATFRGEAEEHVQAITRHLLALEEGVAVDESGRLVEETFREVHTLKGAARSVSLTEVESLCHACESVLSRVTRGSIGLNREMLDRLHSAIDGVVRLLAEGPSAVPVGELIRRLEDAVSAPAVKPLTPPPLTAARAPAPEVVPAPQAALPASDSLRVATAKLDALLLQAEELLSPKLAALERVREARVVFEALVACRHALERAARGVHENGRAADAGAELSAAIRTAEEQAGGLLGRLLRDQRAFSLMVDGIQSEARRLRMSPVSSILGPFPGMVRDLAGQQGKETEWVVHGGDLEADRKVLESLKEPLIHVVRNAIDHGIEPPAERAAARKPVRGRIIVSFAPLEGGHIEVRVEDDGRGIEAHRVKEAAVRSRLMTAEKVEELTDEEAIDLVYRSGLSTSPMITEVSGHGLGLAIVKESVERLGGRVRMEAGTGGGTSVRMVLPATITTFRGLLVLAGGSHFLLPEESIECAVRIADDEVHVVEGRQTLVRQGIPFSLARLADLLGLADQGEPTAAASLRPCVIIACSDGRLALRVDEVFGTREVQVKELKRPLVRVRNVVGAGILSTGELALILRPGDLVRSARADVRSAALPAGGTRDKAGVVLVVDDSITTRTMEKNLLEAAGYDVRVAVDGVEAWAALKTEKVDLVVSDVDMPRMNGFELTQRIREDRRLADLPVVLVTALDSREDKERGVEVGANAYVVKSSFDQSNLLEIIRRLA